MQVDKETLKNASIEDILKEVSAIEDELNDQMHPPLWSRYNMLRARKNMLFKELSSRI